ncbi:hypothetical protein GCM10009560_21900 [Nonomuraea longicatena]|uniref:Uncharacterized protein n=1 Tax=Nonomuraea longicatena TaxID=83682 RepID=A0ABN1P4K6_9ACTN
MSADGLPLSGVGGDPGGGAGRGWLGLAVWSGLALVRNPVWVGADICNAGPVLKAVPRSGGWGVVLRWGPVSRSGGWGVVLRWGPVSRSGGQGGGVAVGWVSEEGRSGRPSAHGGGRGWGRLGRNGEGFGGCARTEGRAFGG